MLTQPMSLEILYVGFSIRSDRLQKLRVDRITTTSDPIEKLVAQGFSLVS